MDFSVTPTITSTTNPVYFKGPYLRQNWSLPDSIIYSISKNPNTPKCYQKLIQSCKYFFSKNSIIACSDLYFYGKENESQIEIYHDGESKHIDLKNICHNFWITNEILINAEEIAGKDISSLIPNIYQCDINDLILFNQIISFNELLFLASKANRINLSFSTIKNEDGSVVFVEKIIKTFTQVKTFQFDFNENDQSISSKTVKNFLKISHFSSINKIILNQISEVFDIETFYVYMKKNKYTYFNLCFNDSISELYENRINEIVDEILASKNRDYGPIMIYFNGLSNEKFQELRHLLYRNK